MPGGIVCTSMPRPSRSRAPTTLLGPPETWRQPAPTWRQPSPSRSRRSRRSVDAPGSDLVRPYPDDLGRPSRTEGLSSTAEHLSPATHLDPPWAPGRKHVVDDDGCSPLSGHVCVLLGACESVAADVDGLEFVVQAKAHGDHLR